MMQPLNKALSYLALSNSQVYLKYLLIMCYINQRHSFGTFCIWSYLNDGKKHKMHSSGACGDKAHFVEEHSAFAVTHPIKIPFQ